MWIGHRKEIRKLISLSNLFTVPNHIINLVDKTKLSLISRLLTASIKTRLRRNNYVSKNRIKTGV